MRATLALLAVLALAFGCQRDSDSSSQPAEKKEATGTADGYARDVDRICNAEEKSGAQTLDEGQRPMVVAQWLGANIETGEGRALLAKLQPLKPDAKVDLLLTEARKAGLKDCALAKAWSGGAKSI